MQVYSLDIEDFSSHDYHLIGIHTPLEDYKLAYLLNQHLEIKFTRANYDLDFENKNNNASFTIYEYTNKKLDHDWFLISNIYRQTFKTNTTSLFNESDTISYLIPEKKKVDFFIKLEGDFDYEHIVRSVEKINQIKQVLTSYTIEAELLKSKEFLIF